MKKLLFIMMVFACLNASAQNYFLTFAGTGDANTIDSIQVRNLTQGTILKLSGTDTLQLLGVLEVQNRLNNGNESVLIYPNPMDQTGFFEFDAPHSGPATIEVFNVSGKRLIQARLDLKKGHQKFRMGNLDFGMNYIEISSSDYRLTGTILCQRKGNETANLEQENGNTFYLNGARISTTTSMVKTMQYSDGELLFIKAFSASFSSVITLVPTSNALINIPFFDCTDGDGNHYSTVKIGDQVWMAENLKTTRFLNGDTIPNMANGFQWATADSSGYCNHSNNPENATTYGRLYNWYSVIDNRNLAPAGWHIPTSTEWQTLVDGNGGKYLAGGKLKETGNMHWVSPNSGASNALGFSALPGGNRNDLANFYNKGINGFWWTQTEITGAGSFGVHFSMYTNTPYCEHANADKHMGFALRCVKD